jgi:hypothetical protein
VGKTLPSTIRSESSQRSLPKSVEPIPYYYSHLTTVFNRCISKTSICEVLARAGENRALESVVDVSSRSTSVEQFLDLSRQLTCGTWLAEEALGARSLSNPRTTGAMGPHVQQHQN